MIGGGDDGVGGVGVINHEGPHFGAGVGRGEVVILFDDDGMGEVGGVEEVQCCGDEVFEGVGDVGLDGDVFATMHGLDEGDVELAGEFDAGETTRGFVVDVDDVKLIKHGVVCVDPGDDFFGGVGDGGAVDFKVARHGGDDDDGFVLWAAPTGAEDGDFVAKGF